MKNIVILSIFCLIFIMTSNNTLLASQHDQNASKEWWNVPYPDRFNVDKINKKLSFIHVEGNKFIDENGDSVEWHEDKR